MVGWQDPSAILVDCVRVCLEGPRTKPTQSRRVVYRGTSYPVPHHPVHSRHVPSERKGDLACIVPKRNTPERKRVIILVFHHRRPFVRFSVDCPISGIIPVRTLVDAYNRVSSYCQFCSDYSPGYTEPYYHDVNLRMCYRH